MFLSWLLLLVAGCLARYDIVCDDTIASTRIEAAIQEAIQVADNARDFILDLDVDTTKAAFEPLFEAHDVTRLDRLYSDVVNVATIPLHITFYCKAEFIDRYQDSNINIWTDTAYTYVDDNQITQRVIHRVADGTAPKPGSTGSSFTTLGFKRKLDTGDIADYSGQAHVHINKKRWDPPANDGLDHRSLDAIVKNGLDPMHTALDTLKPLSETVLHELMHAVGGTIAEDSGVSKINDKPVGAGMPNKIYGYQRCVWVNKHRNDPAAILIGATPLTRADCPTILAKALYLQINSRETYWSTGDVDPVTLKPAGIPPPTSPIKRMLNRIGIKWFA